MVTGIQLENSHFGAPIQLEFFNKKTRMILLYGRNGTGKSTIGEAFLRADSSEVDRDDPPEEEDSLTAFYIQNGQPAPSQLKIVSHVFNESFIDENVKFSDDGIGTVVLFGEASSAQTKIDQLEPKIKTSEDLIDRFVEDLDKCEKRIKVAVDRVNAKLKAGWGDRDQAIRAGKVRGSITSAKRAEIRSLKVASGKLAELQADYASRLDRLDSVRGKTEVYSDVPQFDASKFGPRINSSLLKETLEPPKAAGISAVMAGNLEKFERDVHRAREIFQQSELSHCPSCQQAVNSDYRQELLDAFVAVLDDPGGEFVERLEAATLAEVDLRMPEELRLLDKELAESVRQGLSVVNFQIRSWNDALDSKKKRLYSAEVWDSTPFCDAVKDLQDLLCELEKRKIEHNKLAKNFRRRERELKEINAKLARAECDPEFRELHEAEDAHAEVKQQYDDELSKVEGLIRERERLTLSLKNVTVAVSEINTQMSRIFADGQRLRLVLKDDSNVENKYYLKSRGRDVSPRNLSVGERNVLALCYFFAKLSERLEGAARLDGCNVILDDPVSSLDLDNRIGITSYLESQIIKFVHENHRVNVLIMTHDSTVFDALSKTADSIRYTFPNGDFKVSHCMIAPSEGEGISLLNINGDNQAPMGEYSWLLRMVFLFGESSGEDTPELRALGIGNVMRRLYEAFSAFIYNSDSILSDDVSLAFSAKYGKEMNVAIGPGLRGVLHGGSHYADRVRGLTDFGGVSIASEQENRTMARRLLALMFVLQRQHVVNYAKSWIKKGLVDLSGLEFEELLEGWAEDYLEVRPDTEGY